MNAYPDARWVDIRLRFAFTAPDAADSATVSSSPQAPYSQIQQVLDGTEIMQDNIATLERNRWGLDGGQEILATTTTRQTGWVCSALSGPDGVFYTQPTLSFQFSKPQKSIGFTVCFADGEYPTQFTVTAYNADGETIKTVLVENQSSVAVVRSPALQYSRVVFAFEKTALPYRRVRVSEVLFGVVEHFNADSIVKAQLQYAVDPTAQSLPSRSLSVCIDNSDRRWNLINPEGIYAYLQQPQGFTCSLGVGENINTIEYADMGEFYFATAEAEDGGLTAQVIAYDWFYWLERSQYQNVATGTWMLQEAVAAILQSAGITCEIAIADNKKTALVNKTYDTMSCREALRLTVQAACCTAYFARNGSLVVCDLTEGTVVDTLTSDRMSMPPKVTKRRAVNQVVLSVGDTSYTASRQTDELPQVQSVTNGQVIPANGKKVAEWLLRTMGDSMTYQTNERGNPAVKLTDTVKIYDYYQVNRNAVVVEQNYQYQGGLTAESVAVKV